MLSEREHIIHTFMYYNCACVDFPHYNVSYDEDGDQNLKI